jgi:hypothetical protein
MALGRLDLGVTASKKPERRPYDEGPTSPSRCSPCPRPMAGLSARRAAAAVIAPQTKTKPDRAGGLWSSGSRACCGRSTGFNNDTEDNPGFRHRAGGRHPRHPVGRPWDPPERPGRHERGLERPPEGPPQLLLRPARGLGALLLLVAGIFAATTLAQQGTARSGVLGRLFRSPARCCSTCCSLR